MLLATPTTPGCIAHRDTDTLLKLAHHAACCTGGSCSSFAGCCRTCRTRNGGTLKVAHILAEICASALIAARFTVRRKHGQVPWIARRGVKLYLRVTQLYNIYYSRQQNTCNRDKTLPSRLISSPQSPCRKQLLVSLSIELGLVHGVLP